MWSTSRTQGFWGGDVLDVLFLPLQITPVSCSRPLKTNLYWPDQWAPLPSGFRLDSANCRHQQEIGAWEEKGTYSIHSLPPWSTRVGLCALLLSSPHCFEWGCYFWWEPELTEEEQAASTQSLRQKQGPQGTARSQDEWKGSMEVCWL